MRRRPPSSTLTDTRFPHPRSSDLAFGRPDEHQLHRGKILLQLDDVQYVGGAVDAHEQRRRAVDHAHQRVGVGALDHRVIAPRSEEHTSELQSLMRISYAVFCLKKKKLSTPQRRHTLL